MALTALTATQTLDVETAVCLRRASRHSEAFVFQHLPHPIPRGPTLLLEQRGVQMGRISPGTVNFVAQYLLIIIVAPCGRVTPTLVDALTGSRRARGWGRGSRRARGSRRVRG